MRFVLININEVTASIRNRFKNYQERTEFFIEDSFESAAKYRGKDGNTYMVLSFDTKPTQLPVKFREAAADERLRIFTETQMVTIIEKYAILNTI